MDSKVKRFEVKTKRKIHIIGECCVRYGGSRFQQSGSCKVCLDCGESGGCG